MTISDTPLLTTAEVAERMRVNTSTVRRWRLEAVGPRFLRIGGIYRYPLDELERWMRHLVDEGTRP